MAATLFDVIDRTADACAARPALACDGCVITFAALRRQVRALASHLTDRGVRPGDRVGLMLGNSREFVIAYLASVAAGAIVVPLNDRYALKEVVGVVDQCGVSLLITAEPFRPLCEQALTEGRGALVLAEEWGNLDRDIGWTPPVLDPDAPVMYQFSSGSTGRPKRIARNHRQLLFELDSLAETIGFGPDDRFIGAAPFSHVNGLMRSMLSSLRAGACLYPVARFDRRAVAALIARERISVFIAVPFMFIALAETDFNPAPDWEALRLSISASAPLPARHNRAFHARFGRYVRQLYGSTETGTISVNLAPDIEGSLESVGQPIRGVDVAIVGEDGCRIETGHAGEVVVRSPGAIVTYDGGEDGDRQAFREGGFLTGDLGRLDPQGMLTLHGRITSFINKGGFKIDPREVEELLEEHPSVREAAVFGVPTAHGDERVKALVVLRAPCTPSELAGHLAGRIADFKIPSVIEFCGELPKTPTGKIRRGLLGSTT
jgi:long-chain acyl-CoA synthetase